ncbi:unnamed protein product [Mycena citricolor]|uniref:Uncharacterized protein n=1 Tax=Mycena citricolor TaxID=2018698 RepID=A0AAD2HDW0_9AGAR|nr:unnamed protein product [Mycena citricolor]
MIVLGATFVGCVCFVTGLGHFRNMIHRADSSSLLRSVAQLNSSPPTVSVTTFINSLRLLCRTHQNLSGAALSVPDTAIFELITPIKCHVCSPAPRMTFFALRTAAPHSAFLLLSLRLWFRRSRVCLFGSHR